MLGGSQIGSHSGNSFPMCWPADASSASNTASTKWAGGTKPASDLYLTILQQMGCPVKSFKESTGRSARFWRSMADGSGNRFRSNNVR